MQLVQRENSSLYLLHLIVSMQTSPGLSKVDGEEQIEPREPQTVLSYVQKRHSTAAQVQAVPAIAARLRHTAPGDSIKVSPAF